MSRAAQAVAKAVKELKAKTAAKKGTAKKATKKAVTRKGRTKMDGEQQAADTTEKKKAKKAKASSKAPKPKKAKEPKPKKARNPLAGIRTAPKLPGILLGAEISRRVTEKALKSAVCDWTEDEQAEVKRLLARLDARKK